MTQPLELADQLPLVVLGGLALLEVVLAQLLLGHALIQDVPPPRCRAKRRDLYTLYICCRWDPHPAESGADDEGHRWLPVEP